MATSVRVSSSQPGAPDSPASPLAWPVVGAAVLAVAIIWLLWRELLGTPPPSVSYGYVAVFLLYVLSVWITGRLGPLHAAMGADGRLSTSKFQFLAWTAVVVFSYAWLYAVRAHARHTEAINTIPQNVLLAMGISIVTLAGAKAITSSYVLSGRINKPEPADGASLSDLVANDNDAPDLTKIQMLVWTLIAVVVYLVQVNASVGHFSTCTQGVADCTFPDIDAALMVLMGLGQGAYLGNKLVTVDTPRISAGAPAAGGWGTPVKLTGAAFGATPQVVTVDGVQVPVEPANWKDGEIVVAIPRRRPSDGGDWRFNESMQLGVVVNGRAGVGTAAFQILPPAIQSATPVKDAAGTTVTLAGSAFGARQDDSRILLNDTADEVKVQKWEDAQIVFVLPSGAGFETGKTVRVRLQLYGQPAPTEKQFVVP
jgi:IPT/TIG domain